MVGTGVGFVLGGLIGAFATMAGSYVVYWRQRRATIGHLRAALVGELESLTYMDDLVTDGNYEQLTENVRRPVVYEQNADKLGHLTAEEVRALVAFYGDVYWLDGLEDAEDKKAAIQAVIEKRKETVDLLEANR